MGYHGLRTGGLFGWLLQRVSAAFLVLGLFVHFWVCHFALDKPLRFSAISVRLGSTGWIIFDLLLLLACVYHGFNGLWFIINDYGPGRRSRVALGWILSVLALCLFMWGAYLFIPFFRG